MTKTSFAITVLSCQIVSTGVDFRYINYDLGAIIAYMY